MKVGRVKNSDTRIWHVHKRVMFRNKYDHVTAMDHHQHDPNQTNYWLLVVWLCSIYSPFRPIVPRIGIRTTKRGNQTCRIWGINMKQMNPPTLPVFAARCGSGPRTTGDRGHANQSKNTTPNAMDQRTYQQILKDHDVCDIVRPLLWKHAHLTHHVLVFMTGPIRASHYHLKLEKIDMS